ncbi:Inner membrane protein YbjJ [Streptomyces sp. RB5]|uniref:Inner membrane protein YbjJ n=1 Tax=Streptomyces smaragdinus TaxID=2585196 RepID=A0A7K0CQP8_9ACTN|nr:MFS transporter [Streptomyces smaragdinus]MQY15721.1 Inner membrane protein YbjJ [Streptomyces smaragdinus]
MIDGELRRGRISLAVAFAVQGAVFALLVTRIPALQDQYGIDDAVLPAFLAAVPILAGVGSVVAEHAVRRVRPSVLLRWTQPVVGLALVGAGAGDQMWQAAVALGAFGLVVGALDASMNMLGVSLQRSYGRSIMLGFHGAYSLGGIVGASLAWVGAHWDLSLAVNYGPAVAVFIPLALVGSRWYVDRAGSGAVPEAEGAGGLRFRLLLPLCLVMAFAYIGDATVSNWSAKYLDDVLRSSEEVATVPYNIYMVTTLLGRVLGDRAVQRYGPPVVLRAGTVVAAAGFAVVAVAPGAGIGIAGFTLLGFGLCVIVPQTFAAAGRLAAEHGGPEASDAAVARLNIFNYVGFLVGAPLVGAVGEAWSYRGAMLIPMALVCATLVYAGSYGRAGGRYGDGHERARAADVG